MIWTFYIKMKKSTALFLAPSLLIIMALGLTSCSTPGPKTSTDIVLPTSSKESAQARLEVAIRQAQQSKNWPEYIKLTEQLWAMADSENRLAIEYSIWQTLSKQFNTPSAISQLANSKNPALSSWGELLNAMNQPGLFKRQALQDLSVFEEDALYQSNLFKALQWRFKTEQTVKKVAVLLPFKGKYQHISQQIRNGIIKSYMASDQSISLTFYDSSDVDQVLSQYQLAKQEGADLVIGPLSKEAIDKLGGQNITDIIALNSTDETSFKSFNYRTQSEGLQITQQLAKNGFERIGILTSETSRDLKTAEALQKQWLTKEKNQAILNAYPQKNLNLRKALGDLINEEQSQARHNNLRWLLGRPLEFFPRTRKDLQAIVLVGKADQVAVFHPQFEFFELDLPVYATSNLTPNNLQNPDINKDLSNVIFPTIPAVFSRNALSTELEAFGWDSFVLAKQLSNLAPNLCLNQGESGILFLDGQEIDKKLIWAQYSNRGELMRWMPPKAELAEVTEPKETQKTAQQRLEELMEKERLEALKDEMSSQPM